MADDGTSAREARPAPRLRHSLAARITLLVVVVVLTTATAAVLILGQLRELQRNVESLTAVYVVFNRELAAAQVQSVRIGEQVFTYNESLRRPPEARPRPGTEIPRNFAEALDERSNKIADARAPIDEVLRDPGHLGSEQTDDLRAIRGLVDELQGLTTTDAVPDLTDVLRDQRTQGQIDTLFKQLAGRSEEAIKRLETEVGQAQDRSQQLILATTFAVALVGLLAAAGVFLTMRPLRRLSQKVRDLGRGDWGQRIGVGRPGREDEVSQLAAEFNLMAETLEERERRLLRGERLAAAGQLAAQITHEIRNPLSAVALNAELLEDELEHASPEGRQLLQRISKEVDRLTAITEDYLSFARRSKPELSPIDLGDVLRSLLEFLAQEHERLGVTVDTRFPDGPLPILGDQNQLRQVFLNLLRNAQEAALDPESDGEGRTPRIELIVECKDDRVEVVVSDNGPGIGLEPEQLERIFEAFYTRKARGTGLGLPMVQQILQDHGGGVEVAHTSVSGTRFRVWMPAQDGGTAQRSTSSTPRSPAA